MAHPAKAVSEIPSERARWRASALVRLIDCLRHGQGVAQGRNSASTRSRLRQMTRGLATDKRPSQGFRAPLARQAFPAPPVHSPCRDVRARKLWPRSSLSEKSDATAPEWELPHDGAQHGRFSSTVCAEHTDRFTFIDREVNSVDDFNALVPGPDARDLKHARLHLRPWPRPHRQDRPQLLEGRE